MRASAVGLCVAALVMAACSSGHTAVSAINPAQTTVVTTATSATSAEGLVPTVFNCGGGAYEPATLLVECGDATTGDTVTVTDTRWESWGSSEASGTGTVNLRVSGRGTSAPARLALSRVVQTDNGAQFSLLVVTWTAASPDGRPSDQYQLQVAPAA